MRKWLLIVLMLALLVVPSIAQEDDAPSTAYVRAAHLSVDAPQVDVYVNGDLTLEAVAFPAISDWIEVDPGDYAIDIVPTGGAIEDAVLSETYSVAAGDLVTIAAVGELNRDSLALQPIVENVNDLSPELTTVAAFHAIADLDPVTVFVGDTELATLLSFPGVLQESDGYASTQIVSGEYSFDFQDGSGDSLASTNASVFGANRIYSVFVVNIASDPQLILDVTNLDDLFGEEVDPLADVEVGEGTAQVRVAHFSVSAPAVDVYLDGELALEAVEFGDVTDYSEFDAGIYEVSLVPTGEVLENAAYTGEIAVIADSLTLVAAVGFVEDGSLSVVASVEDNEAPESGFSRIALFQAIPSLELYTLSANDNPIIQGLAFPNAFDGAGDGYVSTDIAAGAYEFVVEGAGATLNVGNVTTGSERVYLIVAAGTEGSPIFFLISSDFPSDE